MIQILFQVIDVNRKTGGGTNAEIELELCKFQRDDKVIVTLKKQLQYENSAPFLLAVYDPRPKLRVRNERRN